MFYAIINIPSKHVVMTNGPMTNFECVEWIEQQMNNAKHEWITIGTHSKIIREVDAIAVGITPGVQTTNTPKL